MIESGVVTGNVLAAHIGCKPSYVVELRKRGRVVVAPDGNGYLLSESLALYRDTADPSRGGVAARHAASRADGAATAAFEPGDAPGATQPPTGDDDDATPTRDDGGHAARRAKALADKEEALAAAAIRENRIAIGELMEASEVEAAIGQAGTLLRVALERIPDVLAPQLAPMTDEGAIRVAIHDVVEEALTEAARQFGRVAQRGEP